jgi:oligoribonuclease NrnB/cAMP/cGMP phosphodiesterase (DHH superfamily)
MNRDGSFEDLRNTANCFVELEKANKKIKELEEENERLKISYNTIVQDNVYTLELEQRIDKAIEYIEQWRDTKTKRIDSRLKRTLEILKGEENE